MGGVVPVVLSWVISPVLAALVSGALFVIIRTLVLRRKNSTAISYWALPAFILVTIWVNGGSVWFAANPWHLCFAARSLSVASPPSN